MAKKTKSKQASWKAKAMGALALAAVFGLPMGTAMAAPVTVDGNSTTWDSLFDDEAYNAASDQVTVNTNVAMSDASKTLTVGNLIFGKAAGTALNNGDMAFTGSNALTFTGGKIIAGAINIFGNTFQQLNLATVADDKPATIHIGGTPSDENNSISAQEFNYYNTEGMRIKNTTIEIADGGTFNWIPADVKTVVSGGYNGTTLMGYGSAVEPLDGSLKMTGGTLNMDASKISGYGRLIELGDVDISGGTVNIGGYYIDGLSDGAGGVVSGRENDWFSSVLYGHIGEVGDQFKISGNAVINLLEHGTIATFYSNTSGTTFAMDIAGGIINMLGGEKSASIIRAASAFTDKTSASGASNAKLRISGGQIKVGEGKYGAIISRDTEMSNGSISVDGTLMVAGAFNWQGKADAFADIKALWNNTDHQKYQWGDFTFSNGTINIGANGVMDFATGNVDFIADGDGTFSGSLNVAEAAGTAKGTLYAKNVTVDTDTTLNVTNLTLAAADAAKSKLTVNGTLVVNGALETAGAADDSLILANTGVLVANYGDLLTQNAAGVFALDTDNADWADVIAATSGAKITLNSTETIQYTAAELAKLTGVSGLLGADVAVNLANGALKAADGDPQDAAGNAIITVEEDPQNTGTVDVATAGGGTANEVVLDATAQGTTDKVVTVNGTGNAELKAKTITVSDTATTTVKISTDATISGIGGTADTVLVAKGENNQAVEKIQIDNSAVNLGVAGSTSQQGGKVGAVEFTATGGTLNVNNGQFATEDISVAAASTADVSVAAVNTGAAAASLNTGGIDLSKTTGETKIKVENTAMNTGEKNITLGAGTSGKAHEVSLDNAASLTAGNIDFGSTNAADSTLAVKNGSTLTAGDIKFGNITTSGNNGVDIEGGNAAVGNIDFSANSTTTNTIAVVDGGLTAGAIKGNTTKAVTITVGDATAAGQLAAASVENGLIVLDPDWNDDNVSTTAAVGNVLNTSVAVLRNSWLHALGTSNLAEADKWMKAQIPGGSLTAEGYTAALAIVAPMELADDKFVTVNGVTPVFTIDTSYESSNKDKATFAANSLLLVDAAGIGNGAALTAEDTTNSEAIVATSAALKIIGGKENQTITILDGFKTVTGVEGWGLADAAPNTLLTDSILLDATAPTKTADGFTVIMKRNEKDVTDFFPELSGGLGGMVTAILVDTYADDVSKQPGLTLVSDMFRGIADTNGNGKLDSNEVNAAGYNAHEAVRTLEGMARIVSAAGVPTLAANLNTQVSSLIVGHNSMLNGVQPAYGSEPGQLGLWLNPFYGSSDVDGMKAGKFENGYEMNYGGAAFGMDYNISERFRLGLALNAGGGDSESEGDFNKTENDFDFWGLNLYSSYSNGAFGLTGDIGYTMLNSEITQKFRGNELNADSDSDIFTVGLTGEYRITTGGGFAVTPHAGLRYSKISTDSFDVEQRGVGDVFEIDTDDQNLFQIPLGVKFGKDIVTDGGWTVSPSADLGVLFTMGDTDVDSRLRIAGLPTGVTNTEVVDKAAFTGALGLQAKADNGLSLGLEYGLLAGGNQTDHQLSGMLRFEF